MSIKSQFQYRLIIFTNLFLLFTHSYSQEIFSSLKYEITLCSDLNKQNIYINNPNNLEITTVYDYLTSKINLDCFSCEEGHYIAYDFENKKQKCLKCPNNTHSKGGKFIINGEYEEWTEETFS